MHEEKDVRRPLEQVSESFDAEGNAEFPAHVGQRLSQHIVEEEVGIHRPHPHAGCWVSRLGVGDLSGHSILRGRCPAFGHGSLPCAGGLKVHARTPSTPLRATEGR